MSTPDFSSPASVAAFLHQYNNWRRDESELDTPDQRKMPDPSYIGRAIDAAVRMLEGIAYAPIPAQPGDCEAAAFRTEDLRARVAELEARIAELEAEQVKQCQTCDGRGEIGGFQGGAAPGYVTEACSDCTGAGHARQQEADALIGLRGCNSQHGEQQAEPCIYRMRTTDPGCTGCTERDEDQSTEAGG